ncbi:hypothetical protein QTP88_022263 [Uroleucon formosanum]
MILFSFLLFFINLLFSETKYELLNGESILLSILNRYRCIFLINLTSFLYDSNRLRSRPNRILCRTPASVKRNRTYGVSHTPLTLRLVICIVGEWGRGWGVSLGSNDNNSLRDDRRDRLLRWQVYNGCNLLQRRERRPHALVGGGWGWLSGVLHERVGYTSGVVLGRVWDCG